jgi:invasion protein IalB
MMHHSCRTLWALFLLIVLCPQAIAQTAKQTSATYDDWTVSCVHQATPAAKTCQMLQTQTLQGQTAQLTRIAITPTPGPQFAKIYFQVPPNVRIAFGIRLFGSGEESFVTATFLWCASSRCVAESNVSAELLDKLAKASQVRMVFKDASEREVAVPISTKGLSQTLNAMNEALMQGK